MTNVDVTNIQELANKFNNDPEQIKQELKRVQSIKCRLLKQKTKTTYKEDLEKVVMYEQGLKEARTYVTPKKMTFTTLTFEQIQELNYDETIKAIKSVQSKKCNSQYLTDDISTNVDYQEAVKLEQLLLDHKKTVKPIDDTVVKKSSIDNLIEHLSTLKKLDKDYVIELLEKLKQGEV